MTIICAKDLWARLWCGSCALLSRPHSALVQRDANGTLWKLIEGIAGFYVDYWTNDDRGYARLPAPANDSAIIATRLYKLSEDEAEARNVAADYPRVVAAMQARLKELGEAKNGYRHPQTNVPLPGALPKLHNGTWSPWQK